MHRDFADWYRIAAIELTGEMLEKRWQAIEPFVESLDVTRALELARLFHKRPTKDSNFVENYCTAFKATDPTFSMRGNDLELRILAGATFVHLLEKGVAELADAAALGMVCAGYRGCVRTPPFPR